MSNSWFESSFKTRPSTVTSTCSASPNKPVPTSKPVNEKASSTDCDLKPHSARKRQLSKDLNSVNTCQKVNISDFVPNSSNDLAISKQKLAELKSWFSDHFSRSPNSQPNNSPFLLLNGPAGSGKTASIKVLTKEYKVELVELPSTFIFNEQDAVTESLSDLSIKMSIRESPFYEGFDQVKSVCLESQQNRFRRLLYDLNYCKKSIEFLDGNCASKLLLIEDIPQIFHIKPELLHEELISLKQKFKSKTVPIVFVISDTVNGPSVENKVLPKYIQTKLNFQVISLKPVTNASLTKTLSKSSLAKTLNKLEIEEIVLSSSNDIRNAFNYLLFKHSNPRNKFSSTTLFTKKAKISFDSKSKNSANGKAPQSGREEQLTLVHAVGKILYAKRSQNEDVEVLDFVREHPHFDQSLLRNPLIEQRPEEISERANTGCDILGDWVYENYYDFINENDSLNFAVDCLEVLSVTNSLFKDFESRQTMENIATSYLIRGQMYSFNRDSSAYKKATDSDKSKSNKSSHTFRPLRGPHIRQLNKETNDNLSKLLTLKNSLFYNCSIVTSDKNLVLDILPSITSIDDMNKQLSQLELNHYVHDLCEYSSGHRTNFRNYSNFNSKATSHQENEFNGVQQYNYSNLLSVNRLAPSSSSIILTSHSKWPVDIDSDNFELDDFD